MVNLLRIIQQEIDSSWFVVNKPFGIPTLTTTKVTWDITQRDSIMNRILVMGYDHMIKAQQVIDKKSKTLLTTPNHEGYDDKTSSSNISSLRSMQRGSPLTFSPLWNMANDSRGLLPICQGMKSIEFFRMASKCKLIQRSYIVLVERDHESSVLDAQFPEKLEGYTLRSDQFWAPKGQNPRSEERIYMLFCKENRPLHCDHPWLSSNQRLSVIPFRKVGHHKGTYFHIRTKILHKNNISKNSKRETSRHMYSVDLIEGNEEIIRCVFSHYGYPIANDIMYNTEFAMRMFRKQKAETGSVNLSSVDAEISSKLLEMALQPNESQFLHLGMFCYKTTFPDPGDQGNKHQIERAQSIAESSHGRQSPPFTENLNAIIIELAIPSEFTAWVNGERIPGISAKNGIKPIEKFHSLAKKILDPHSIHENFQDEEENTIMVRDNVSQSNLTLSTGRIRVLRNRVTQYTPSVDTMSKNLFEPRLPVTHRSALLCKNCGDFHSENYCPILSTKNHSNDGYEEFYRCSTQQSTKVPYCITCGIFGHSFRRCVHSYTQYGDVIPSFPEGSDIKFPNFPRKRRQCQICKDVNHIELHCAHRKTPPWGYDELGQPLSNSKFRWKEKGVK